MLAIFFICATLLAVSCKECPTEPDYDIYLSVEDVFCTSVTLNVTLPDSGSINTFVLDRNDSTIATFVCYDDDTLITDENLTPDTDYTYSVCFIKDGKIKAESETITVHTMPTTSHDFYWEVDTLGDYGSSLKDVFAISENDVWVVGEITSQNKRYGAALWDGTKWTLKELDAEGINVRPRGIWAFSNDNIWFACGGIFHWDGTQTTYEWARDLDTDESVEKVWGSDPDNIYFVGKEGIIIHYDGANFTRMDSGTNAELKDIDGVYDPVTGKTRIWVAGVCVLLYSEGKDWKVVWDRDNPFFEDNYNNPNALFVPDNKVFISSVWGGSNSGVYTFNQSDPGKHNLLFNHNLFVRSMDGNDVNDFFIVGDYNKVYHYNGSTVKKYNELEGDGYSTGISQIENIVFIVGMTVSSYQGIIFRGKRQ